MRYLEKFLDAICENRLFLGCQIFVDFLKIESENEFQNRKKEYTKMKPAPTKLNDMSSLDAHLNLKISKDLDANTEVIKGYINLNEHLIKKLGTSYKNLFLEMNTVSLRLREISDIYEQLHAVSYKTNDVFENFI
jgi:hypothetical protein